MSKVEIVEGGTMGNLRVLRSGPIERIIWMVGSRKVEDGPGGAPF